MKPALDTVIGHLRSGSDPCNDHDHDPTDVFRLVKRPSVLAHPQPVLPHPRPALAPPPPHAQAQAHRPPALAHPRLVPRLPRAPRGTDPPPPVERRRMVTPSELDFEEDSTTMPTRTYARQLRAASSS
jgi:hypothetical protein